MEIKCDRYKRHKDLKYCRKKVFISNGKLQEYVHCTNVEDLSILPKQKQ